MSQPAARLESGGPSPLRCSRCGVPVHGTRHTRTEYEVGHYVLHTGPTEEATIRRGVDEAPFVYRRLVHAVQVIACPACFREPATRALWETFGDAEATPE